MVKMPVKKWQERHRNRIRHILQLCCGNFSEYIKRKPCQVVGTSRTRIICHKFYQYTTRQVIRKHYEMKGKSFLKLEEQNTFMKNETYIFPTCATATVWNLFALVICNKLQTTEWKHFSNNQFQFMYNYISLIITLNLCTTIFHYATV